MGTVLIELGMASLSLCLEIFENELMPITVQGGNTIVNEIISKSLWG